MDSRTQNIRECKNCGKTFAPLRKDASFCSPTCRWSYWKANKNSSPGEKQQTKEASLINNLQGVISGSPDTEIKEHKILNPVWKKISQDKQAIISQLEQLRAELNALNQTETSIRSKNGDWMIFAGAIGGAIGGKALGSKFGTEQPSGKKEKKPKAKSAASDVGMLIGMLGGGILGATISKATEKDREAQKQKALAEIQNKKLMWQQKVKQVHQNLTNITQRLLSIPQWEIQHERVKIEQQQNPKVTPELGTIKTAVPSSKADTPNAKIISSNELEKLDYKALHFKDKWANLFGYPSFNFHCVIHGMSGEGKSTFAIQFANYLSENFGKVVYVSGEEGFSKTFKDKFTNNNASSDNLFVADLRKLEEVLAEIPNDEFNFIFIDSLDNMRIDADGMKRIRARYKDSAIITISQSTKDGKMRGSYEIVHDSDIAVKVENGNAVTTKNRFKQKGMEFQVF